MPGYTFVNEIGEIICWNNFYIPREDINEFNKVIKEYYESTKTVPDTWKLVNICFKDGHLRVPTLEEFKSVPYIKKTVKEEIKVENKENSILQKLTNMIKNIFTYL